MKVEAEEEAELGVVGTELELEVVACCHCYLRGGGETEEAVERRAELEAGHHRCSLCTRDFHNY